MIGLPAGTRIWIAAGVTDMCAGMNGLAAKVQITLAEEPLICGGNEYVAAVCIRRVYAMKLR